MPCRLYLVRPADTLTRNGHDFRYRAETSIPSIAAVSLASSSRSASGSVRGGAAIRLHAAALSRSSSPRSPGKTSGAAFVVAASSWRSALPSPSSASRSVLTSAFFETRRKHGEPLASCRREEGYKSTLPRVANVRHL